VEGFYFWRGGLVGGPRVAIWTMQRREAEFWVALAGPVMNILLARVDRPDWLPELDLGELDRGWDRLSPVAWKRWPPRVAGPQRPPDASG
jgi:hypothetical protein